MSFPLGSGGGSQEALNDLSPRAINFIPPGALGTKIKRRLFNYGLSYGKT